MAQKVQVLLLDDIDGKEADETLTFALDGKSYEIDLTSDKAAEIRKFLEPYVKAGRKTGGRAAAGTRSRAASKPARPDGEPTPEEYRAWARKNGLDVNDRGRVPASVKEAYAAANA
ncbi:histone-like nucleoid-structuring protein Lsr2 [Streptomyces sp. CA-288835]|uniref:histone-like nucleoid-structuring protein Lsr2 n=1 Tax=Streptomyces sp. CA-288835 TaxID=3240069 RepID=UPI003D8C5E04